jgi:DNA repair protein RadA/Sms
VETIISTRNLKFSAKGGQNLKLNSEKPQRLSEIKLAKIPRFSTGIEELNRVLGGGVVPGSVVLLAGEPGIGKSTLLLQLAAAINSKFKNQKSKFEEKDSERSMILYICGEESPQQIKLRADRLGIKGENLLTLAETEWSGVDSVRAQHAAPGDYR